MSNGKKVGACVKMVKNNSDVKIKGKSKKDYMRDYMQEYTKRPEVKKKRREQNMLKNKQRREKSILEKVELAQKHSDDGSGIKLMDITRLDGKNRITLGRNACNIIGVSSGEEIAIIKQKKQIRLIKLSDIRIICDEDNRKTEKEMVKV